MIIIVLIIITILLIYHIYPFTVLEKLPYNLGDVNYYNNIPLVIYRSYDKRYTNKKMYDSCHKKWIDLNPMCKDVWYTPVQCKSFLKEFDIRVYNAYNKLKPIAFKSDLWRLCILYKYGGIYADCYTTPYKTIKVMLERFSGNNTFISVLDGDKKGIHNGFIIVTKQHPFLLRCIENIVENVEAKNYTDHVLGVTGPLCLAKSIRDVLNTNRKFKVGWNMYGDLSFYLFEFEWGPFQYIKKEGYVIMSKKYSLLHYFYSKIIKMSLTYNSMWKRKDIYN
jgi:mannosyltransferase OCH1-like enzyme